MISVLNKVVLITVIFNCLMISAAIPVLFADVMKNSNLTNVPINPLENMQAAVVKAVNLPSKMIDTVKPAIDAQLLLANGSIARLKPKDLSIAAPMKNVMQPKIETPIDVITPNLTATALDQLTEVLNESVKVSAPLANATNQMVSAVVKPSYLHGKSRYAKQSKSAQLYGGSLTAAQTAYLRNPARVIHLHVDNRRLFAKRQISQYPFYYPNPIQVKPNHHAFESNLQKEAINRAPIKGKNFGKVFDLDQQIAGKFEDKAVGLGLRPVLSKTDEKISDLKKSSEQFFEWFKRMFSTSMSKLG